MISCSSPLYSSSRSLLNLGYSILRVPFISSVKLRAILLKTGPGDQTPSKVLLFATADSLDFEDVEFRDAAQELIVAQGRDVGEYTVKSVISYQASPPIWP
jgi:hypothetical protein